MHLQLSDLAGLYYARWLGTMAFQPTLFGTLTVGKGFCLVTLQGNIIRTWPHYARICPWRHPLYKQYIVCSRCMLFVLFRAQDCVRFWYRVSRNGYPQDGLQEDEFP